MPQDNDIIPKLNAFIRRTWQFIYSFRKIFIIWAAITAFIVIGVALGLDRKAVAFLAIVFAFISQAFLGLLNLIALVPIVGPLIAKVLALPFYWILNSLGYFASVVAIKKGYKKDVLNYRVLTVVFLVGIVVGFIIGKIL